MNILLGSGFGESKEDQKMENFHFSLLLQLGLEQLQSINNIFLLILR